MVEPTCVQFEKWRNDKKPMRMVQQDNAGVNEKLQASSDQAAWKLHIQFEYTAKDTPEKNHLAELGFITLLQRQT